MPQLYETSLSDLAWEVVEPIFEVVKPKSTKGRPRKYCIRSIVDAAFYIVKNGCTWRCLPNDFPPFGTVYHYFRTWSQTGIWELLNQALVAIARTSAGKNESPSLICVDAQSQSAEPGVDNRGIDGHKKVNGRKRHIAVDTMGLILVCLCTAANESDIQAGQDMAENLNEGVYSLSLKKILGDNGYQGVGAELKVPVSMEANDTNPKN